MNPLAFIKAVFDRSKYQHSSVRLLEGSGTFGEKPWPFNYCAAVEQCRSWVYRCAYGNAEAASAVPLRMYIRKLSRKQKRVRGIKHGHVFNARQVRPQRHKWLTGEWSDHRPSQIVCTKVAEFGDEFEEITDHPALTLLRKVNPQMNGYSMASFRFVCQELTGNAYFHPIMSRELGGPVELWPMLPQWTHVIPGGPDSTELVEGYTYGQDGMLTSRFEPDEVLHYRRMSLKSLYYGFGKVEAAWQALGILYSQQVMQKALFDNHARPDWLLTIEGATPDQVDNANSKIKSLLRGVRKAGTFLTLGGKVTATPLAFSPNELGADEGILEEIAGVFGYPITKLKANDPNRANAETGDVGWMKDTILPMLRQDEEDLNQNGYLALFGNGALLEDAILAYDDPVPANKRMDLAESKTLVAMGVRTINEDRLLRGDEEREGGDILRVNGVPLDVLGQPPAGAGLLGGFSLAPPPASAPAPVTLNTDEVADKVLAKLEPLVEKSSKQAVSHLHAAIVKQQKKEDGPEIEPIKHSEHICQHLHEAEGDEFMPISFKGWRTKADADDTVRDDEQETPIQRFARDLAKLLEEQERAVLRLVQGGKTIDPRLVNKKLTEDDVNEIEREMREIGARFADAVRDVMGDILTAGAVTGLERIDAVDTFDISNPRVAEFLNDYTIRLAGGVTETTVDAIRSTLQQGIQSGESISQLRDRVQQTGAFSRNRAETIARTESARAHTAGAELGWQESGVVQGKKWLLAPNACPYCKEAARIFNSTTTPLGQPFAPQGSTISPAGERPMVLDYSELQGPPLHPNCRCDIMAVLTET